MKRRIVFLSLLIIILIMLVGPHAYAASEVEYIINGHGWGHGVGMCQYGARGRALAGHNYQSILKNYYRGVEVKNASTPSRAKIGISLNSTRLKLGQSYRFNIYQDEAKTKLIAKDATGLWEVRLEGGKLSLYQPNGSKKGTYGSTLYFDNGSALFELQKYYSTGYRKFHIYRGNFLIRIENNKLKPINIVGFEYYLRGLTEVPTSWPLEAQKAQAVAARSYILANLGKHKNYDICDSVHCQVYTGYDREKSYLGKNWVNAVSLTKSQVIFYQGKNVAAYYHSTCGGKTENNENVWGYSPIGYLRGVNCGSCQSSPYFSWTGRFYSSQVEGKLGSLVKGRLLDMKILKVGFSPRVLSMRIYGTSGYTDIKGSTFKSKLGLRSNWFNIKKILPGIYSRLSGPDIFSTNTKITQHGWPKGAQTVILARHDIFPDALTGESLTAKYKAPLLLTQTDILPDVISVEIGRLKPKEIIIIGGYASVSLNIENSLRSKGYKVHRIAGVNSRYETSAEVAFNFGPPPNKSIFLVSGESFQDAALVSGLVNYFKMPILLTKKDKMPVVIYQALRKLGINSIFVVGNSASLSSSQLDWLEARGFKVKNISPDDDFYQKSYLNYKYRLFNINLYRIYVINGDKFQETAITAPLTTRSIETGLLFVDQKSLSSPSAKILEEEKNNIKSIYVIGNESSVGFTVEHEIKRKLK